MVDLPNTMVDLPNNMVVLPKPMVDLPKTNGGAVLMCPDTPNPPYSGGGTICFYFWGVFTDGTFLLPFWGDLDFKYHFSHPKEVPRPP
jgi:hypothetical protein